MIYDDEPDISGFGGMSKTGSLKGINRLAPRSIEEASTPEPEEDKDGDEREDERDDPARHKVR